MKGNMGEMIGQHGQARLSNDFDKLLRYISSVILGKEEQIMLALACLFARGHLLIEDIPGIGKTTLAKVLAQSLGLEFSRIQCTSDMLPSDILGTSIFEQQSGKFIFHPGPIFTQLLLADEINRTTPKTQSALLEAMEERQVSTEGETRPLERPFFVVATQNPLEQSGTFPLPESQLDRFLMRIHLGYPPRHAEKQVLKQGGAASGLTEIEAIFSPSDVLRIQDEVTQVFLSDSLLDYIQDLLEFSRDSHHFSTGLSPRAGIALSRAAQSWAYMTGKEHVLPEHVQTVLPFVVTHRLKSEQSYEPLSTHDIRKLFMQVPVPN